jgi:predicted nucleic acid-binding protein
VAAAGPRSFPAERLDRRAGCGTAPLIAYFDTSALIKLVVLEDGSATADELWSRASLRVGSRLVYPEGRAALAAAARAGRIDETEARGAATDLRRACSAMRLVGVDWTLAEHAGTLAELHGLRGYDAVHLATALAVDDASLVVATWDRDLARAASRAGRPVAPPVGA